MSVTKQMPQYQSHKKVWGLKIKQVCFTNTETDLDTETDGSGLLTFIEKGYGVRSVSKEYMSKHKPRAKGYFVVYEDGYESWSPADVFEAGNTRINVPDRLNDRG